MCDTIAPGYARWTYPVGAYSVHPRAVTDKLAECCIETMQTPNEAFHNRAASLHLSSCTREASVGIEGASSLDEPQ